MVDQPTREEVQKVRKWECSIHGHSFDTVMIMGSTDPQVIYCRNCGETWNIVKREKA